MTTIVKIKYLSNNGRAIPIQKLSDAVLHHFEALWSTTITSNDSIYINSDESDNETDDDDDTQGSDSDIDTDNTTNDSDDYDSNDELQLADNKDAILNVNIPKYHGVRLFNSVKQELADSYFQVTVNKEKKYLHKQSACWFVQKEKAALSADRLSRVQGK